MLDITSWVILGHAAIAAVPAAVDLKRVPFCRHGIICKKHIFSVKEKRPGSAELDGWTFFFFPNATTKNIAKI